MEQARRNGNVHHRTSHMMMMMMNYSHIVVSHGVRTVYPANDVWFTPVDGAGVNSMALLVSGEYVGLPLYGLQLL